MIDHGEPDLAAVARAIIGANRYMVLGTADEAGRPWVSPVYYAAEEATEYYWMSAIEATHSRNIARRPQVSIVVFDSQVPPGTGQGVYMSAVAEELADPAIQRALEVYPGPPERGVREMSAERFRPPAPHRLYRAVVSEHWVLCPNRPGPGLLCPVHQRASDHRTPVVL